MLGILAGLLLVAGLVFGFTSPKHNATSCGTVFTGLSDDVAFADDVDQIAGTLQGATPDDDPTDMHDACSEKLDDRRLPVYGLVGLAVVALIVSFVASGEAPTRRSKNDGDFRAL